MDAARPRGSRKGQNPELWWKDLSETVGGGGGKQHLYHLTGGEESQWQVSASGVKRLPITLRLPHLQWCTVKL